METTEPLTLEPYLTGTQSHTFRTIPTAFSAAPPFQKLTLSGLTTRSLSTLTTPKNSNHHTFWPF